jgi:DNA-binding PadR family transcriptional regulator
LPRTRTTDSGFSPQVFHILLALAAGPLHGYAIMQAVEQDTDGNISLGPGTLYGAVRRLSEEGLIEETRARRGEEEGRRYYKLTAHGRAAVSREAARLAKLVDVARARRMLPENA